MLNSEDMRKGVAPVTAIRRAVFARHSNPLSAWSRWASSPLVVVPFWTRRTSHAVGVAIWMLANPVIFPKPASTSAWATRVVLGEELRIQRRPLDAAMVVNVAAATAALVAVAGGWRRSTIAATAGVSAQMVLLLVYWKLMADYYDDARPDDQ
jgi:hypothetical protein